MSKFQVGDRVAVYFYDGRYTGTVTAINRTKQVALLDTLWIDLDKKHPSKWVHSKQCRKLIKKPRRRIWVAGSHKIGHAIDWTGCFSLEPKEGYTEFVEVRRK